ncbi:hypothetical protein LCGC14_0140800 [marine sediment metagenome]|uniref:ATP-grasp domain-containing protein n=1 Tax=marine sediment metagenome TaxID=412755 RepID=A0A0F9V4E3_9ZZZZ
MKPTWVIQTNMEGVDTKSMIAEVERQGMEVDRVEYDYAAPLSSLEKWLIAEGVVRDEDASDACVLCYGDVDFVKMIKRRASFIPGTWCNFENMKCSTYFAYLGRHLLNREYAMMPLGDLMRRWNNLTEYPPNTSLFIRPDSGAKPFTGYVVKPDKHHKIESLIKTIGPEVLVVVSPEKQIDAEWRFVICNKKVITGCRYLPDESVYFPQTSFRLAQEIAQNEWQPDICYTVDIAESGGEKYLLEINSFSCAGLYLCDMESIIRHASKAAIDEWREYFG